MKNYNLEKTTNTTNDEDINVIRNYKDTVFRMLFNNKENLLELYNGVNNKHYTNVDDLTINTLENAIYLNMKNDVSCIFNFSLNIYEHQSTYNPNMPLRNLFYVAKLIEKELIISKKKNSLYGEALIQIPAPEFIVFYNGTDKDLPDKTICKLSDSYIEPTSKPKLELEVTILNINIGKNKTLFEHCQTLYEYSLYVDCVRKFARDMPIAQAVPKAVDYCIEHNILAKFLKKNKAEVVAMSILECNYEEELEKIKYSMREVLTEEIRQEVRHEVRQEVRQELYDETRNNLLLEQIQKKLQKGKSLEVIADETEQPIEVITNLINSLEHDNQVTDN